MILKHGHSVLSGIFMGNFEKDFFWKDSGKGTERFSFETLVKWLL